MHGVQIYSSPQDRDRVACHTRRSAVVNESKHADLHENDTSQMTLQPVTVGLEPVRHGHAAALLDTTQHTDITAGARTQAVQRDGQRQRQSNSPRAACGRHG